MKEIEVQALALDRLFDALKNGIKENVNLLQELTGEVSFKELRAAVYTLAELGYISHDESIPDHQGFFCKITKEGIKYHQDIFEPQETEKGFFDKIKDLFSFFEKAKNIAFTVVTILCLIFGFNIQRIAHQFPVLANLIGIEAATPANQKQIQPKTTESFHRSAPNIKTPTDQKIQRFENLSPIEQRQKLNEAQKSIESWGR